jgi:photosystem I subunit PsaN
LFLPVTVVTPCLTRVHTATPPHRHTVTPSHGPTTRSAPTAQVTTVAGRATAKAPAKVFRAEMAAAAAAAVLLAGSAAPAHADLTEDLLAKSQANAELHNKQRLASSYSNFARSRTVTDGTCKFPGNVLGCDLGSYAGDVKYIADDVKLECSGKEAGKCASNISIPQRNQ